MKRLIAATLISGLAASSAIAGGFSTTIEEPDVVVVTPNSSSGEWMPLIIFIALVAVASSASD